MSLNVRNAIRGLRHISLATSWLFVFLMLNLGTSVDGNTKQKDIPVPLTFTATGVAVAHRRFGLTGKGQKIAVMDSGINYKHPAFGACKKVGPGCRVSGGFDFVGTYDLAVSHKPDSDPMDCGIGDHAHGTQVASVAAGDGSMNRRKPWRGVAYGANLLAYKASGSCQDSAGIVSTNASVRAIRKAAADGADVLNLSYGDVRSGAYVDPEYAAALVAAMQQGALVTIASGNDGWYGPWLTEGAVAAPGVISTAAVEVSVNVSGVLLEFNQPLSIANGKQSKLATTIRSEGSFLWSSASLAAAQRFNEQQFGLRLPLAIVRAEPTDACSSLSKAAMRGNIVVVARGKCTFAEKARLAAAAGAAGVIIYNKKGAADFPAILFDDVPTLPVWAVKYTTGQAILAAIGQNAASSKQKKVTMEKATGRRTQHQKLMLVRVKRAHKDDKLQIRVRPADFSSWGPSATLELTPTLAAPGMGLVVATSGSDVTTVDGTSFAAPFVAGALALWRQTRPSIKPQPGRYVISSATSTASIAPASSASKGSSAQESSPRRKPAVKKTWVATTWESVRNNVLVTAVWKPAAAAAEAHTVVAPLADTISGQGQQQALLGAARLAADQDSTGLHPPPLQAASLLTSSSRNGLSSSVADANDIRPNSHQGRGAARGQVGSRPAPAGHVQQGTGRGVKPAGKAAAGYAGQAAAYAAFVSTAKPLPWSGHQGWAYPVAQVGAGLIQVDAAIVNPTTLSPNHLLLRSNQRSQTLTFTASNAAPFPITYKMRHMPAAAVSVTDTWLTSDANDLLKPWAASAGFRAQGKAVHEITVPPGGSTEVEVNVLVPSYMASVPALYSGYITLTPISPSQFQGTNPKVQGNSIRQQRQAAKVSAGLAKKLWPGAGIAGADVPVPFAAVPLVLPYQGFTVNYTTHPILVQPNFKKFPNRSKNLAGMLHVCYSDYAHEPEAVLNALTSEDYRAANQDGFLHQPHVDRCLSQAANASALTKLPLADLKEGYGVIMVGAALSRPAVRMQLMLFNAESSCRRPQPAALPPNRHTQRDAAHIGGRERDALLYRLPTNEHTSTKAAAGHPAAAATNNNTVVKPSLAAPGCAKGQVSQQLIKGDLVGEVWQHTEPSRDFPEVLRAYYGDNFEGKVAVRDPASQKVLKWKAVQPGRKYKMQLWVTGPLAAADKAAGEQYHVFKHDIPGTFVFI